MGYDMYIVAKDATEQAAYAAANKMLEAATTQRDTYEHQTPQRQAAQEVVDALMRELYRLPSDYFRLNIWGMSRCGQAMYELGMLDTEAAQGEFPDAKDFGVTDEMWDAEEGDEAAELRAYNAAVAKVTDGQCEKPTGIPAYKFGSNDGWLATPDEIAAAVATYDERAAGGASVPDFDWWADWIGFLRRAQVRGGFRVH